MSSQRRGKNRLIEIGAGVTAAVVLATGAGTYFYRQQQQTPDVAKPPSSAGSVLNESPAPVEGKRKVQLFVDGWSAATLSAANPGYKAGYGDELEEKSVPLKFTPVTTADIGAIAAGQPDILTRAAARMITVDPKLACTADGCKTADGDMPMTWFTDPSKIPGLGKVYSGYGISGVLYKADLDVPEDATTITLTARGYQSGLLIAPDSPAPASSAQTEEPDGTPPAAGPMEGYGRGWYLASAALGRFFTPQAAWLGSPDTLYTLPDLSDVRPDDDVTEKVTGEPPFAAGLATADKRSSGLTNSQMTMMTSPTTGCGVGVICAPTVVKVTVKNAVDSMPVPVCLADEAEQVASVVFHTADWEVTFPQPVHQFGVWNGKSADSFEGARKNAGGMYSGVPELVSGKQTLHVSEALVMTGRTGKVAHLYGSVGQFGKDAQESLTLRLTEDDIPKIANGAFRTC
jgi:hypothetical protein